MSNSTAATSLWPDDLPTQERRRPLRYKEEPAQGQRVYVAGVADAFRFFAWQHCGRRRFAILLCNNPACRDGHVASEEMVRVDA